MTLFLIIFLWSFLFAYTVLDATVPPITTNRVGGIVFWRCGRFGGSFYRAKGVR